MKPRTNSLALTALALTLIALASTAHATVTTLPVPQLWQHKDHTCCCCDVVDPPWCPTGFLPHPDFHAPNSPWGAGCPHCAAYCAPASIMMIRRYRGLQGCPDSQDCVYDRNKGEWEIQGDFRIQTHGIGMTDAEVFAGFLDGLGEIHLFSNSPAGPAGIYPITSWVLRQLLCMGTPVAWIDRDGLPQAYMPPQTYAEMTARGEGHVKVLAGYDDRDTYCETADDLVLVFDPWPSPGGCLYPKSPYWLPVSDVVFSDIRDIFIADRVGGAVIAESTRPDATAYSNGRRLVRDPVDGSYCMVFVSSGRVFFTKSTEPHEPGSWSAPVAVDNVAQDHYCAEATLAINPNPLGAPSELHAVYVQSDQPGLPGEIYHSMSFNGGQTWDVLPFPISNSPLEDSRHPSLEIDGHGKLHVVYDETGLEWGREIFYSNWDHWYGPWTPTVNISRIPTEDSRLPTLATSYDDTQWDDPPHPAEMLHVAWCEYAPYSMWGTIYYRCWEPATGWVPPLPLMPEEVTGGMGGTCPSIMAGPDKVARVVWTSSLEPPEAVPTAASDVYFNRRENGVWGPAILVSPPDGPSGTASICPTIAFSNGPFCMCMQVAWEEWDPAAGTGDVFVCLSRDLGTLWTDQIRVTYDAEAERRFPTLAYKNGTSFSKGYDLDWSSPTHHFDYNVCFLGTSRFTAGQSAIGEPVLARGVALQAWPNPFRGRVEFAAPGGSTGLVLQIFDSNGRRVRELLTEAAAARWVWDGRDSAGRRLPQGVYFTGFPARGAAGRVVMLGK
jgi:hypothetical protein